MRLYAARFEMIFGGAVWMRNGGVTAASDMLLARPKKWGDGGRAGLWLRTGFGGVARVSGSLGELVGQHLWRQRAKSSVERGQQRARKGE